MSAKLPVRQRKRQKQKPGTKNYKHSTTTRLLDRHYNHFNQVSLSTSMTTTLRGGERGTVIRPAKEPRSFIVKNDRSEGVYFCTRSQPKPRPEVKDDSIKEPSPTTPETAASQDSPATQPHDGQPYTTRSGQLQNLQTD